MNLQIDDKTIRNYEKECREKGANANPYSALGDHIGEEIGGITNEQFRQAGEYGCWNTVQSALKSSAMYNIEHEVGYLNVLF